MASTCIERRFKDELHASNCLGELYSLWQYEHLCDLTLKVGGSEFKVHKVILVSCSQYFKSMFTEDLSIERGKNYVELFQIDEDAFKSILEYFYTGYITLTEKNVQQVLRTADFYCITAVKSICCEYLSENIHINNCLQKYTLGAICRLEDLKSRTKSFIMEQLDEVSKTDEFRAISRNILTELLTSDKENNKAEQLYNATMQWVRHDIDNRKSLLPDLLLLIPTKNISYDFYIEIMKKDKILREDFKCTNWLLDNFIDSINVAASVPKTEKSFCTACTSISANVTNLVGKKCVARTNNDAIVPKANIFATSRVEDKSVSYLLKPESDELVILPPRPAIILFSAVYYQKHIYLTAGELAGKNVQKSFMNNTLEGKWSEIELNFERCSSGSCILGDQLYIIGGFDCRDYSYQKSCIYHDFNSDCKFSMAEMAERRELPGVGVFNNSIYVSCGKSSNMHELSSIIRFDPREGIWYDVGSYKVAKGQCSSTVISDFFYTSMLWDEIVESFDFRNNQSQELPKPTGSNGGWIAYADGNLLRIQQNGFSQYVCDNDEWLANKCFFDLEQPIILSFNSI